MPESIHIYTITLYRSSSIVLYRPSSPSAARRLLPRRGDRLPGVDLGLGGAVGLEGAAGGGEVGAVLGDSPGAGVGGGGQGIVLRRGVDAVGEPGVPERLDLGAVEAQALARIRASAASEDKKNTSATRGARPLPSSAVRTKRQKKNRRGNLRIIVLVLVVNPAGTDYIVVSDGLESAEEDSKN